VIYPGFNEINCLHVAASTFSFADWVAEELSSRMWRVCRFFGWRVKKRQSLAMLFLPGESIAEWTEMVIIERIVGTSRAGTMDEITQQAMTQIRRAAPRSRQHLIEVSKESASIAFEDLGPEGEVTTHQLIRLVRAPRICIEWPIR
jgi:hypothetical protein